MQPEEKTMARGADRLEVLCELNRRLATFTDLDELLRYATRRARELFDADGCALSWFDRGRRKLYVSAVAGAAMRSPSKARRTGQKDHA